MNESEKCSIMVLRLILRREMLIVLNVFEGLNKIGFKMNIRFSDRD